MLKIPGIFKNMVICKLFPFIIALRNNNIEMFYYFWTELDFIYGNESTFETLFR